MGGDLHDFQLNVGELQMSHRTEQRHLLHEVEQASATNKKA